MKIEVKNIKWFRQMSEETNAFTADVYINGKKAAYAKNDGCGGNTYYHAYPNCNELVGQAEGYCKDLPHVKYEYGGRDHEFEQSLESVIDDAVEAFIQAKERKSFNVKLQKAMQKGIVYGTTDSFTVVSWKGHTIASIMQRPQGKMTLQLKVKELKNKGENILNTNLPEEWL